MINLLALALVGIGIVFVLVAGIGLLRMKSVYTRMQVTTKASAIGVVFLMIGVSISMPGLETAIKGGFIVLFLLLTAPLTTHILALVARKYEPFD